MLRCASFEFLTKIQKGISLTIICFSGFLVNSDTIYYKRSALSYVTRQRTKLSNIQALPLGFLKLVIFHLPGKQRKHPFPGIPGIS